MIKTTFEEEKQYLKDCASEELEYLIPFVITDPHGLVNLDDFIPYKTLTIDLAETKSGGFENFVREFYALFSKEEAEMVVIRNIDRISSRKDKESWKRMVKTGLKSENFNCILHNDDTATIPFAQIKIICTCSHYPDYLKKQGNLGIGPDFYRFPGS